MSSVSGTWSETTSDVAEQLVERLRVDDAHAVRHRELLHGLADAAVADDAERHAGEAAAEHERRRPLPRLAAAQEAVALYDATRERKHERDRHLGSGVRRARGACSETVIPRRSHSARSTLSRPTA